jgi:DNA-binding transcriptional ArsR family regulator
MSPFEVMAEPHRRLILDLLREDELPVGQLVRSLKMSQPAVSKHLRVLRNAGLVSVRGDAQRRLYSVRPEPLQSIDDWLEPYRRIWSARLDDLQHHLADMAAHEKED